MKNVFTVILAVTTLSLLVFATKTFSGGPPEAIEGMTLVFASVKPGAR